MRSRHPTWHNVLQVPFKGRERKEAEHCAAPSETEGGAPAPLPKLDPPLWRPLLRMRHPSKAVLFSPRRRAGSPQRSACAEGAEWR